MYLVLDDRSGELSATWDLPDSVQLADIESGHIVFIRFSETMHRFQELVVLNAKEKITQWEEIT